MNHLITLFAFVAITFAILAAIVAQAAKNKRSRSKYSLRACVMSEAERAFFIELKKAANGYDVFPKLRVADVIQHGETNRGDFFRISQKHFDWVICEIKSSLPIAAIELDDSSHNHRRSKKNDETKNSVCKSAGLPLIRFKWQREYSSTTILSQIQKAISAD